MIDGHIDRPDVMAWLANDHWMLDKFHGSRTAADGGTWVRYIECPYFEVLQPAVQELMSAGEVTEFWADRKRFDGRWRTARAWYEEIRRGEDRLWRLYHAIVPADAPADGPNVILDGCMFRESVEFYWDQPTVQDCPAGSSGVAYRIEGIHRDEETQLWSYQIIRRERLYKAVGPVEVHQENGATVKSVRFFGLREWVEGDTLPDGTVAAGKVSPYDWVQRWAAANSMATVDGDGVVVDYVPQKNDDCSTDAELRNTLEEFVDDSETAESKTAFEESKRVTDRNLDVRDDAALAVGESRTVQQTAGGKFTQQKTTVTPTRVESAAYEGQATIFEMDIAATTRNAELSEATQVAFADAGQMMSVREEKTPEGRKNVTNRFVQEQKVPKSAIAWGDTARGGFTRFTDTHLTKTEAESVTSAALNSVEKRWGSEIQTQTVERSKGGLYNVTIERRGAVPIRTGKGNSTCEKTIFQHRDSELIETERHDKGDPALKREVDAAGGGKYRQREIRLNDDGSFNIQDTTTEELKVENARVVAQRGAITTVAVSETANDDSVSAAKTKRVDVTADLPKQVVGTLTEYDETKTPGGRTTTRLTTRQAHKVEAGVMFKRDIFGTKRQMGTFRNITQAELLSHALSFDSGSFAPNEFGLFDGTFSRVVDKTGDDSWQRRPNPFEVLKTTEDITTATYDGEPITIRTTTTYVAGIINDNADLAYEKVDGCANPRVQHLGRGYYSYYGIRSKQIVWEKPDGTILHEAEFTAPVPAEASATEVPAERDGGQA